MDAISRTRDNMVKGLDYSNQMTMKLVTMSENGEEENLVSELLSKHTKLLSSLRKEKQKRFL